jgi:hypothetical protein
VVDGLQGGQQQQQQQQPLLVLNKACLLRCLCVKRPTTKHGVQYCVVSYCSPLTVPAHSCQLLPASSLTASPLTLSPSLLCAFQPPALPPPPFRSKGTLRFVGAKTRPPPPIAPPPPSTTTPSPCHPCGSEACHQTSSHPCLQQQQQQQQHRLVSTICFDPTTKSSKRAVQQPPAADKSLTVPWSLGASNSLVHAQWSLWKHHLPPLYTNQPSLQHPNAPSRTCECAH